MNPRIPYEAYEPPARLSYEYDESWHLRQKGDKEEAAIFYVHSTNYLSPHHWNSPPQDTEINKEIDNILIPNEVGPVASFGSIYAPKYRQATKFAFFTQKHQGRAARLTAYRDIKRAFEQFLMDTPINYPIILIGYEQGGLHIEGLLIDYFQDNEILRKRLVVAYIIDHPIPLDLFDQKLLATPPCMEPTDIRCIASWSAYTDKFPKEIKFLREKPLIWEGDETTSNVKNRALLCINPVSWSYLTPKTSATEHLGASSATGLALDDRPAMIEQAISVTCDDGIALTSQPRQKWLRRPRYFAKQWRPLSYNLFYQDIETNAQLRLQTFKAIREEEEKYVPPIEILEEVQTVPIKKVPKL
ncbi:MAG: DUF3089 domain-containing protein [bacterium]